MKPLTKSEVRSQKSEVVFVTGIYAPLQKRFADQGGVLDPIILIIFYNWPRPLKKISNYYGLLAKNDFQNNQNYIVMVVASIADVISVISYSAVRREQALLLQATGGRNCR